MYLICEKKKKMHLTHVCALNHRYIRRCVVVMFFPLVCIQPNVYRLYEKWKHLMNIIYIVLIEPHFVRGRITRIEEQSTYNV